MGEHVKSANWARLTWSRSSGSQGSDILTGGGLNPEYFSTQGAFNGSGIALASQSFQGDEQGTMVLYYQHYTGTIRYKQLRENDWVGGTLSEVVAFDAKNGTPISAVAYALNNVSTVSLCLTCRVSMTKTTSGTSFTSTQSITFDKNQIAT